MEKPINKNIVIDSIDAKMASTGNMKYILKDTEGLKYFFWQKNKGQDSDVYLSFTGMGVKKGDTVSIGYTEEAKSFVSAEGKTIDYTDRFILGLREANGSTNQELPRSVSNNASQSNSNDNFGLRLAIHGMVNGLLASGKSPEEVSTLLPDLFGLEEDIEMRLNKPVSLNVAESKINKANEELPTIQQDEEINVDDIPF